jgi:diguanylate cyclase (GGDEF)-like protein/PAS domain S-box-containing protein
MDVPLRLFDRLTRSSSEQDLFEELAAIALEHEGIAEVRVERVDADTGAVTVLVHRGAVGEHDASAAVALPGDEPATALRVYAARPEHLTGESLHAMERIASVAALIRRVMRTEAERFRLALSESELSLFTMDADLRYTWLEAPSLGLSGATLVGRSDAEILPPDSVEALTALKRRVLETGAPVAEEVAVGERHFWLTMQPLLSSSGAVVGLTGQATNVTTRRRAELELERLASAAEHGMDAVVSLDLEGRVQRWNDPAERLFGHTAADMLGRTFDELLAHVGLDAGGTPFDALTADLPLTYEVAGKSRDGTAIDLRITLVEWRIEDARAGVTAVVVDISERVRAERDRERAIEQLHDAQRLAGVGSWTQDPDSGEVTWSPQLYEIYGIEPSDGPEPRERGLSSVHPDDRERMATAIRALREHGTPLDVEHRIVTPDGTNRTVRTIARRDPRHSGGFFGTTQDVSEQRRAEQERERLRELDALFTIGFTTSPMGMVLLSEAGEVLQANDSLARTLGYPSPEAMAGMSWRELVHAHDHVLLAGMAEALTSGDQIVTQVRYATADGGAVHGVSATTLVRGAPGQPPTIFSQILDVTERVRAERDLAESETRYRRILETTLEGVWTLDADDVTTFANPALAEILDAEPEALVGRPLADFVDAGTDFRLGGRRELPLRSATGRRVWALVAASPMEDPDGRYLGALAMVTDISDRKAMEVRLQHLADHDHLTGIFNRRRLLTELDEQLRVASRTGRAAAALVVDLDHFKFINDTHGHLAGDRVLRTVAEVLRSRLRSTDVVARLGGDEFALVLPEVSEEEATAVAHELQALLAARDARPPIVASVGVVHFTGSEELTADEILVCADTALYEAKEHGGNQVRLYRGQATGALRWVQRIRSALAEDRLVLHGQPILDLRSGKIAKHELLVRMLDEDGTLIPPGEFLPTAERFGLIQELDAWVARRGLMLAAGGRAVTINLSGYSVDQALIESIARGAVLGGLDPSRVTFEITETAALTNLDAARQFVEGLAELGFSVALDDFGTGFGSFVYLKHVPARFLKIDMEFVRGLRDSAVDREVVRSIVGIARALDKETIAEGVEDADTLDLLRSFGVDYVQGYVIGRPGPLP